MKSHRSILVKAAEAVADSREIAEYCREHFGRALDITVGAYASGVPTEKDSPFLWITPSDREESEMVANDEVFQARFVVAGCVKGDAGERVINARLRERTESENGLTVNGGNEIVETLRDMIAEVVLNAKAGAIVSGIAREENDISHFPLEWATMYVTYFEPEAL